MGNLRGIYGEFVGNLGSLNTRCDIYLSAFQRPVYISNSHVYKVLSLRYHALVKSMFRMTTPIVSLKEVKRHNKADDVWIVIHNKGNIYVSPIAGLFGAES